jgi:hypothetical protein
MRCVYPLQLLGLQISWRRQPTKAEGAKAILGSAWSQQIPTRISASQAQLKNFFIICQGRCSDYGVQIAPFLVYVATSSVIFDCRMGCMSTLPIVAELANGAQSRAK